MLSNDTEYINLLLCLAIFFLLCYLSETVVDYKDLLSRLYLNRVAYFLGKLSEINSGVNIFLINLQEIDIAGVNYLNVDTLVLILEVIINKIPMNNWKSKSQY